MGQAFLNQGKPPSRPDDPSREEIQIITMNKAITPAELFGNKFCRCNRLVHGDDLYFLPTRVVRTARWFSLVEKSLSHGQPGDVSGWHPQISGYFLPFIILFAPEKSRKNLLFKTSWKLHDMTR